MSWVPETLTPGKSIFSVPSKETPPRVLTFANDVAVPALPSKVPLNVVAVTIPVNEALPSVETVATPAFAGPTWIPDLAVTNPIESTLVTSA